MSEPLPSSATVELTRNEPAMALQTPDFKKIESFTTFNAEYAVIGQDLVFHFYLPAEYEDQKQTPKVAQYWMQIFPTALDVTARTFFNANYPRLKAAYTPEMVSWWFRAHGFANVPDPVRSAYLFAQALDKTLDASNAT